MKYTVCPPNMIEYVWSDIVHHIEAVVIVSNNEFTAESLKIELITGKQLLCLVTEVDKIVAIFTLERREFDSGLVTCYIPIIAGRSINTWFEGAISFMKIIANNMGATELRGFMTLKGWGDFLRYRDDWKDLHTVMSLQIGEE